MNLRTYTLTAQAFSRIMAKMKRTVNDRDYHKYASNKLQYIKLFTDNGFVPCFSCKNEIPLWSQYAVSHRTITSIGIRKYYHIKCLERLYN